METKDINLSMEAAPISEDFTDTKALIQENHMKHLEDVTFGNDGFGEFMAETGRVVGGGVRDAAENTKNLLIEVGGAVSKKLYTTDFAKSIMGMEDVSDEDMTALIDDITKGYEENTALPDVEEPQTAVGKVAKPFVQFLVPFGIASKTKGVKAIEQGVTKLAKGGKAAKAASAAAGGATAGAIADVTAFDGHEERLSNLLVEMDSPLLNNAVTQYLAADENDSELEGRMKQVLEGLGAGALIGEVVLAIKAIKNSGATKELIRGQQGAIKFKFPKVAKNIKGFVSEVKKKKPGAQPKGNKFLEVDLTADELAKTDAQLKELLGKDVSEVKHIVQEEGVRHALNKHAGDKIPLKEEDFELIPDILANPDNIRNGGDSKLGNQTVVYEKHYGDRIVYIEEFVESKKKGARLRLKTMYWNDLGKNKKKPGELLPKPNSHVRNATRHQPDELLPNGQAQNAQSGSGLEDNVNPKVDIVNDELVEKIKGFAPEDLPKRDKERISIEAQKRFATFAGLEEKELMSGDFKKKLVEAGTFDKLNQATLYEDEAFSNLKNLYRDIKPALETGDEKTVSDFLEKGVFSTLKVHYAAKDVHGEGARVLGLRGKSQGVVQMNKLEEILTKAPSLTKQQLANRIANILIDGDIDKLGVFAENAAKSKGQITKEIINEWYMNSILSSPKTLMVDTISNILWSPFVALEKVPAAAIGKFRKAMIGGENGVYADEAFIMLASYGQSVMDGLRLVGKSIKDQNVKKMGEALEQVKIDNETRFDVPRGQQAISSQNMNLDSNSTLGRTVDFLGNIVNYPSHFMQSKDDVFKAVLYRAETRALAHRSARNNGLTGKAYEDYVNALVNAPTMDAGEKNMAKVFEAFADDDYLSMTRHAIHKESVKFARVNTFQESLGQVAYSLQQAINAVPGGRILIPFIKTPTNLAKHLVRRTPLVTLAPGFYRDLAAGGAQADMAMSRLAVGTSIMYLGWQMAASGTLTGEGPLDPKEKQLLMQSGWRPRSIRIGDSYIDIGRYDPLSSILLTAANLVEVSDYLSTDFNEDVERDLTDYAAYSILAVSETMLSKTFALTISDFMESITSRDADKFKRTLNFIGSSFVTPNVANFISNEVQPMVQQATTLGETIRARYGQDVRQRRDIFGRPLKRDPQTMGYILPSSYSSVKNDGLVEEMLRVGAYIPQPEKRINGVKLNADQYARMMEIVGEMKVHEKMANFVKSSSYKNLPEGLRTGIPGAQNITKAGMLKRLHSEHMKAARSRLLEEDLNLKLSVEDRLARMKSLAQTTPAAERFLQDEGLAVDEFEAFLSGNE